MSNFRRRSYHSENNFYRLAVALKIKRRLTRFYCILNLLDVLQVCGFTYGKAIISTGCYHGVLVSRSLLEVRLFQCRLTWCRVVCLYYTVLNYCFPISSTLPVDARIRGPAAAVD